VNNLRKDERIFAGVETPAYHPEFTIRAKKNGPRLEARSGPFFFE
jgi:hypothetical protein